MSSRTRFGAGALLLALFVSGCGLNMEKNYRKLRPSLLDRDYDDAASYVEKTKTTFYDKDNRLLYYMDMAMVLYLAGKYQDSNVYLEKAKDTAEELWTESVGKNALAWVTTDNSLPYQGEDFEKVMLHVVAALDYIGLGDYEAARVEARQVTEKLELYNSKYETEHRSVYSDDAFARWLSGKLRATEGGQSALNDAWIDYKKAIQVYRGEYATRYQTPLPRFVVEDAMLALRGLGHDFAPELRELQDEFPSVTLPDAARTDELGEVVFVHLSGEAPYKRDRFWTATGPSGVIRIAYPEFVAKAHAIRKARLSVAGGDGQVQETSELAEDVTAIAIQNLNDHMARIKAKAIARAIAKFAAAKGMQAGGKALSKSNKGNAQAAGAALQVAGVLFNVGSAVAEEADKRSWITLPAQIGVGRLYVAPGPFQLQVDFVDAAGRVVERAELKGEATAGKTTFLAYRTYR